jgi:hypothetical protein
LFFIFSSFIFSFIFYGFFVYRDIISSFPSLPHLGFKRSGEVRRRRRRRWWWWRQDERMMVSHGKMERWMYVYPHPSYPEME